MREGVSLVPNADGHRRHLAHPFNGRFRPVDHRGLEALVATLVRMVDVRDVDVILGFPEGGTIPAYAFGRVVDRPVLLASRLRLDLPAAITFEEPHSPMGTTQFLYGLHPGQRVLIVEDEVTNGRTALNAVRALRAAGVVTDQIVTLMAVDHPALWRRMEAMGVTLHVGARLPIDLAPRPIDNDP